MFEYLSTRERRRGGSRTLLVSLVLHLVLIGVLIALPLWYFQELPAAEFVSYLSSPPPEPELPRIPVPAPPEPRISQRPTRIIVDQFTQPTHIPTEIPEAPAGLPQIRWSGPSPYPGAVPGGSGTPGIPGIGDRWGIPGGVGEPGSAPPPPPPPPPARREPIKISHGVEGARLIHRVDPDYPEIARLARVQGPVVLQATIDEEGRITNLRVVRGNPLLIEEALSAVRQWRYSPTLLNGEPVPVITTVTVIFKLK